MCELIRVQCPRCGKWVKLVSVMAGITRFAEVTGLARGDDDVTTVVSGGNGFILSEGVFAGFQCSNCHRILAVDGPDATLVVRQRGRRTDKALPGCRGEIWLVEMPHKGNYGILFFRSPQTEDAPAQDYHVEVADTVAKLLENFIGRSVRLGPDGPVLLPE